MKDIMCSMAVPGAGARSVHASLPEFNRSSSPRNGLPLTNGRGAHDRPEFVPGASDRAKSVTGDDSRIGEIYLHRMGRGGLPVGRPIPFKSKVLYPLLTNTDTMSLVDCPECQGTNTRVISDVSDEGKVTLVCDSTLLHGSGGYVFDVDLDDIKCWNCGHVGFHCPEYADGDSDFVECAECGQS